MHIYLITLLIISFLISYTICKLYKTYASRDEILPRLNTSISVRSASTQAARRLWLENSPLLKILLDIGSESATLIKSNIRTAEQQD